MVARLWRFSIVSGLGAGVQVVVLEGLTRTAGMPYLIATMAAVASAVLHNFLWHCRWTWKDRRVGSPGLAFLTFALANGLVSLAGNVVAMAVLVGQAGLDVLPANAIAIALCGLINYALADKVAFRARLLTRL